jgi:3-phytase
MTISSLARTHSGWICGVGLLVLGLLSIPPAAAQVADTATVDEVLHTPRNTWDNVDTPAVWHGAEGQHWLLTTAKEGDVIRVHDAATGDPIRRVGESGSDLGEFDRPNGVAVIDDLMLVVERDNRRVQVFSLPSFEPLGAFGQPLGWQRAVGEGEDRFRLPYGLTVYETDDGTYMLYVTDAYAEPDESVPPPSELDGRVKQFRFTVDDGRLRHQHIRNIGATSGPGMLKVVESLWADPAHDRLLIAEEKEGEAQIKVYTLDGTFTGTTISSDYFQSEAEGIMLYECGAADGYWLTTDQSETQNTFHLFDRTSLEHVGAFRGETVTNTDGIFATEEAFGPFENGAFYAVHNDRGTVAFDWTDIAAALDLERTCAAR